MHFRSKAYVSFAVLCVIILSFSACMKKSEKEADTQAAGKQELQTEEKKEEGKDTLQDTGKVEDSAAGDSEETSVTENQADQEKNEEQGQGGTIAEDQGNQNKSDEQGQEAGKVMEQEDRKEEIAGRCFQTEKGIASSPVLQDQIIYFGSKDGNFYAVDIITQKEVWKYSTGNPILCQAAVQDDRIFFSSNEVYYALDIASGELRWSYDLKAEPILARRRDQWDYHDSSPVIDQGVVYFGSATGKLLGFDTKTGDLVWEHVTDRNMAVRATPHIQDGVIYYGDWLGTFQAVDIKTKEVLWQNKYSGSFQNSCVAKDDILIIGGRDTSIRALKLSTGEELWSYKDPSGSWITGDPVIVEDTVYFPTSDAKKVYAMKVNDGTIIATYPIYKNSFTRPIIENGYLYVTSGDAYLNPGSGKLEVFDLKQPSMCLWEVDVPTGGIFSSPLPADGMIYFGAEDGYLYGMTVPDMKQ